ncbi:MAG: hypothetical protein GYB33_06035 [Gammaproteobacteria bacterium]|nr:hypothetical protein [Gammaproteobacteria bacterium]
MKTINGLKVFLPLLLALWVLAATTQANAGRAQAAATGPATSPKIALILSGEEPLYRSALQALSNSLSPSTQITSYSVNSWQRLSADQAVADHDFAIAVGALATETLLQTPVQLPLLSLLVPSSSFKDLVQRYPQARARIAAGQFTAIYMDQPALRQLNLARLIAPQLDSVGTMYDSASTPLVESMHAAAAQMQLKFQSHLLQKDDNPLAALRQLYREIDVFIAVPGKYIFNRPIAKWMLYLSFRKKKPLLGFSADYVRAGALAAVFSSPEDVAEQASEWLQSYTRQQRFTSTPDHPAYFSVLVNREVAELLNLELPTEALLEMELGQREREF